MGPAFSYLSKGFAQFFQSPFLNAGHVTSADAGFLGHLPLAQGTVPEQSVPEHDHLPFLFRKDLLHRFADPLGVLPGADPVQHIVVLPDHIHQRQSIALIPGLNAVGQGYILRPLPPTAKVHQDLICYPLPNERYSRPNRCNPHPERG